MELRKLYMIASIDYDVVNKNKIYKIVAQHNEYSNPTYYDTLEEAEQALFTEDEYEYGDYTIIPVYDRPR